MIEPHFDGFNAICGYEQKGYFLLYNITKDLSSNV